jgi:hypothetical protein
VSQSRFNEPNPHGHALAVTAIEHDNIVITVASLAHEPFIPPATNGAFITTIIGGPLRGATWESRTWSAMIRNHSDAVSRVAKLLAPTPDTTSQADEGL